MKALTKKQYEAINNIGLRLDEDSMNELLKIVLSKNPEVNFKTKDNMRIRKDPGETGSIYIENVEVGKLASIYSESPEKIMVRIATKVKNQKDKKIIVWHFFTEFED